MSEPDKQLIAHAPTDLAFLTTALRRAVEGLEAIQRPSYHSSIVRIYEEKNELARQALADIARAAEGRDD